MSDPTRKALVAVFKELQALDIIELHKKADTDSQPGAAHHTLGGTGSQAASGDHTHDGRGSRKIGGNPPVGVSGSRGGNVALANLLTRLAALGIITDSTSA